ncbi:hypothetical protein PF008_g22268 [Phytophthora fragariae]|uniref:C2H2-type domain-containing protein n=1 Tax=Phytophthora fragariae TaxID=53985 RepID=A0A6G0QU58_9STRA|nr:hypothetical protein PF008_g22268 [Phytophthora fragariae]
MVPATFMCHECQGFFPTEVALAKHLMDHNRLKALRRLEFAAPVQQGHLVSSLYKPGPIQRPCQVPFVPSLCEAVPIQRPYQVPPPPPMCDPNAISTGTQLHTGLVHGIVVHYNDDNGFGFIKRTMPGAPSKQVYFHISKCNIQTPRPRCGESVYFTEKQGPKGPQVTSLVRSATTPPAGTNVSSSASVVVQPPLPPGNGPDCKTTKPVQTMLAESPSFFQGRSFPRFVYVDLDNVWVSFVNANHLVGRFPSAASTRDLLLNLDGFTRRLATGEEGSSVSRLVAFYFNTPEGIANRLRKTSHGGVTWDVRKQEATTDTTMQLELLNAKRPCETHPKTLVLVTGDGNIATNGMCFREILDLYLRDGWFVEVHAWLSSLARSYTEFQRQYPSTVVIRPFDDKDVLEIVNSRMQPNSESSSTLEKKANARSAMQRERGIVVSYEVVGGFGTIAKVGAAAGSYVRFQSSVCNIKRPPPTVGEKVMLVETMGPKGPTASVVYRKVSNKSSVRPKKPQTAAFQGKNKAAAKGRRSHTQDDLAAALTRAMRAMSALNSPKASSNTNTSQLVHPAVEQVEPKNQRQLCAEHYEYIINQLNHSEFGLYLPSALAILRRTHEREASTIEQTDPATQRELLLVSLQEG